MVPVDQPIPSPTPSRTLSWGLVWTFVAVWLLMLASFSAPAESSIRVSDHLDAMAKVKIVVRMVVVGALGLVLLTRCREPQAGPVFRQLLPLAFFVAWAVVSTLWSPLKMVSLGQAAGLVALLLIAALLASEYRGASTCSAMLGCLSVGLLVLSGLLLAARFAVPHLLSVSHDGAGLFHSTNAGATASLGILLLLSARLLWNWRWSRYLLLPGMATHTVVLVLSQNRTSLAITCVLVGYLLVRYGSFGFVGVLALGGSICTGLYMLADPGLGLVARGAEDVTAFVRRGQSDEQLSNLSGRQEMWEAMWASFLDSPWIGHGYFVSSSTGSLDVWYEEGNWTAHNVFLQCLVSTGAIGALLLALGVLSSFRSLWPVAERGPASLGVVHLARVILSWFLIWGIFNESVLGPLQPESIVFCVIAGLTVGAAAYQAATATMVQGPRRAMFYGWVAQPSG